MRQVVWPPTGFTADQSAMRRQNLALTLRTVGEAGPLSRARLAEFTGLNKATISSLVTELAERGLVVEGAVARGDVGRPSTSIQLNGAHVCGIGAEVRVGSVAVTALDLSRDVLVQSCRGVDTGQSTQDVVVDVLADLVGHAAVAVGPRRIAGVTVALPGLVDVRTGDLLQAPNLGWTDVPVAQLLHRRLDELDVDLRVDNEANLAALAEAAVRPRLENLVVLNGASGVGAGAIVNGSLVRGSRGFAGEVGHMPIELQGGLCGCGRRGCWETRVGLTALLTAAAAIGDDILDPALDLEQRTAAVVARAKAGEPRTLSALEQVGTWLGLGTAVIVNVLDPQVIVLGGYFARIAPWIEEPMTRELHRRVIGPAGKVYDVEVSSLGLDAPVRGAALMALQSVLDDPTTVPRMRLDQVGA